MNANQLINMIIRQITRHLVRHGVNAGIDFVSRRGKRREEMTDEDRKNAAQTREGVKRAGQASRLARRIGR